MEASRREVIGGAVAAMLAGPATAAEATTLSPRAMQADVALLRRAYETLHPGLYRYLTPREAAARFDTLAASATRPMGLRPFYLALSRRLATVRCGHSYANFYNQTKAVQAALFDAPTRLPLQFLWLGNQMIVTADPFGTGIAPGSSIAAIDGRAAGEALAALMQVARADGHNDAKRRRLMSVQGEDGYESFDIFHDLLFGGRERYRLEVIAPGGARRSATVAAVTLAQRRSAQRAKEAMSADAPIWTIERRGGAAVLTMDSWGLYNAKWDWRAWIDQEMDRLIAERVGTLVIDVRRNEGGEDCGNAIIARLIDRPITFDTARRLVRYTTVPADLQPHCDTWDRSFDRLGVGATRVDEHFLELTGPERGAEVIRPKGRRYAGRVIVLIGPQNSSATFGFAQVIQRERLGALIGEPTGGNRRGINGGCFYFFRLPETGLEADLPLIGTFPRTPQPDAGIVPDVAAPVTPASIARGADPAMARALA